CYRDWSSDVCSSDLRLRALGAAHEELGLLRPRPAGAGDDNAPQESPGPCGRARRRARCSGAAGLGSARLMAEADLIIVGAGAKEIGRASCRGRIEAA